MFRAVEKVLGGVVCLSTARTDNGGDESDLVLEAVEGGAVH